MKFRQRTEMTNRGHDQDKEYGWPESKVGLGIEVEITIDDELKEIMPDALSQKLGHFLRDIMQWHYAPHKSVSVDTRVDPWPLPETVGDNNEPDKQEKITKTA